MFVEYQKENETEGLVTVIDHLNKPTKSSQIEVTEIPQSKRIRGKMADLYVNLKTKQLFYKYTDRPLTSEERFEEMTDNLKSAKDKYAELDKAGAGLDVLKAAKIAELKQLCTEAIYGGFESSVGHAFGYNELDQSNFTKQAVMILLEGLADTAKLQWKSKDAGVVELTVKEFKVIAGEAKAHQLAQQAKYWQLEAGVLAATSNKEVDLINW